jgi:hypothetical protein
MKPFPRVDNLIGIEFIGIACVGLVAIFKGIPQVFAGLFVCFMLISLVMPRKGVSRSIKVLLATSAALWALLQLLPELRFFEEPSLLCVGVLALPAALVTWSVLPRLDRDAQNVSTFLAFLIPIVVVAYVLPYIFAVPAKESHPLAGIGCFDIGCGTLASTPGPLHVYKLAGHFAGTFSLVLLIVIAVIARLLLQNLSNTRAADTPQL